MSTTVDITTALSIPIKKHGIWGVIPTPAFFSEVTEIPTGACLTSGDRKCTTNGLYYGCVGYISDEALLLYKDTEQAYAKIALTFDENGGSAAADKTVYWNRAYGALPNTTKTNYTLDGWYTADTGGTKIISTTVVSAEDITSQELHAQWTYNQATNWVVTTTTVTYDGSVTRLSDSCLMDSGTSSMDTWVTANYPVGNYAMGYVIRITHKHNETFPTLPTLCTPTTYYYATAE